jgi:hypothetical protein
VTLSKQEILHEWGEKSEKIKKIKREMLKNVMRIIILAPKKESWMGN